MAQDLQRVRAVAALLSLVPALDAAQGEGTFDPAFAGGGHFVFGYPRPGSPVEVKENFFTVAVDAEDRIVVAGACFAGASFPPCAARHQPDGGADTSFSDHADGLLVFGSSGQYISDSFVQADGSTVVCGSMSGTALVGRLTPQGLPDTNAAGAPSGIRTVAFPSGTYFSNGRGARGPHRGRHRRAGRRPGAGRHRLPRVHDPRQQLARLGRLRTASWSACAATSS